MKNAFNYAPAADLLGGDVFAAKLVEVHQMIGNMAGFQPVGRIAVASYDADTDELKTFALSDRAKCPLTLYSAPLSKVPSLKELANSGEFRVVSDLDTYIHRGNRHSDTIIADYRSSLTVPIKKGGKFYGFVFFNSEDPAFFTPEVMSRLLPYTQLLGAMAVIELDGIHTLTAAVNTARTIGHFRDDETGAHLHRMASYTRLIATTLAPQLGTDDTWVEMLTHFAPMHDVGKVAVPDTILFKPGKLDPEEFARMKEHVSAGMAIVDALLENFGVQNSQMGRILRDVVGCHHETPDGKGYPRGLASDGISIEARIITVADVFDALTSARPYKQPWSVEDTLDYLKANAGVKFDADCINALAANLDQVAAIRERYPDSSH